MANITAQNSITSSSQDQKFLPGQKVIWKRRRSKMDGYEFTIYTQVNRRLFRVDYSSSRKRIRLLLEDPFGKRFWSEIENGKVVRSNSYKSVRLDKSVSPDPITANSDIFSTIPDPNVYPLIAGNHSVGENFLGRKIMDNGGTRLWIKKSSQEDMEFIGNGIISALDTDFRKETRNRYFRNLIQGTKKLKRIQSKLEKRKSHSERIWALMRNLLEISLVLGIGYSLFHYNLLSPLSVGALIAGSGIILGGIDFFGRNEDPFIPKVLSLAITGGVVFFKYYGLL